MTVYRIQHKTDKYRGPYCIKYINNRPDIVERLHKAHGNSKFHPSPFEEFHRSPYFGEFCGFASASDLLRWFKGFIPDLLRAGFEIVRLNNITVTAYGKYQVLFRWED